MGLGLAYLPTLGVVSGVNVGVHIISHTSDQCLRLDVGRLTDHQIQKTSLGRSLSRTIRMSLPLALGGHRAFVTLVG